MALFKAGVMIMMVVIWSSNMVQNSLGAGECGKTPVNVVAQSLTPCIGAAKNANARVAPACCAQVRKLLVIPSCLCAVFLSPLAKQAGINLSIAISIPKRCNIRNRPVGKKCGRYVIP